MIFLFFQLENIYDKLLDYGVLGIVLIGVCIISLKMYNKINEDGTEWRNVAKNQIDNNYKTNLEQNRINQRLIDIQERDTQSNREFHTMLELKMNELPKEVRAELKSELNEQNINRKYSGK
jgi:hypothetical protein